jgi:hypothetical protein
MNVENIELERRGATKHLGAPSKCVDARLVEVERDDDRG